MDRENLLLNIGAAKTKKGDIKTFISNLKQSLQKWSNVHERRLNALSEQKIGAAFVDCKPLNQSKPLCEVDMFSKV